MVRLLLAGGLLPAASRPAAGCLPLPIAVYRRVVSKQRSGCGRFIMEVAPVRALSTHALSVCVYVRACVFTCVRVRACVCTRYDRCNWRFSAPSLIGLRIGLRRDCRHWWGRYATTCACPRGGAGTCVQWTSSVVLSSVLSSVLRPRHNRAMRIALLQGCQGACHHPTTASAAGEPARRRRRAPQEPLLLRAKPSRTPSSWARFSVVFSRSGDLSFPIFTKPTTMDSKWQDLPWQFLIRSSGRCGRCGGRARPVLGAVAGAGGLTDGSPVRIRPPACCAACHRCLQRRCAR